MTDSTDKDSDEIQAKDQVALAGEPMAEDAKAPASNSDDEQGDHVAGLAEPTADDEILAKAAASILMAPMARGQGEMPFAVVEGQPMTQLPLDLYIPPDALEVFLDAFEGPLDLLLYLIKRQNLDILEIKVAEITRQYMDYIDLMKDMHFELAAEYLVMAAVLAEIKSRMLLPRQEEGDLDEDDPRAELIRRLQEYERFKQAALDIDELERMHRDYWVGAADVPKIERERPLPDINLQEMMIVLSKVLKRAESYTSHRIELEPLSTRERMSSILDQVQRAGDQFVPFVALFTIEEGRAGVIVTFLATMELIKESLLEIVQTDPFSPIHVKTRGAEDRATEIEHL